jgi:hypothetical protein
MNAFGNPVDYDIRIIRGRKTVAGAETQSTTAQDFPTEDSQ